MQRIVTKNGKIANGIKSSGLTRRVPAINTPLTLQGTTALIAAPASLRTRVRRGTKQKERLYNIRNCTAFWCDCRVGQQVC